MNGDSLAAIKTGNRAAVTLLLDVDLALVNASDENGLAAVLIATYCQEPDVAKLLVQHGAIE